MDLDALISLALVLSLAAGLGATLGMMAIHDLDGSVRTRCSRISAPALGAGVWLVSFVALLAIMVGF
jgi:NO-binding membrane sensor protein with MHYT domain